MKSKISLIIDFNATEEASQGVVSFSVVKEQMKEIIFFTLFLWACDLNRAVWLGKWTAQGSQGRQGTAMPWSGHKPYIKSVMHGISDPFRQQKSVEQCKLIIEQIFLL